VAAFAAITLLAATAVFTAWVISLGPLPLDKARQVSTTVVDRNGTPPAKLTGIPSDELMKRVTRDADYARWTKDFLGG